jgi:hypothetical protein
MAIERTSALLFLFLTAGSLTLPGQSVSAWAADPQHPQLQYRVKCSGGAATVEWRNGYPGEVTLKARVRSDTYDGTEDLTVEPGSSGTSDVDTLYCSPGSFRITVARFAMKPPTSPGPVGSMPSVPQEPVVPTVSRYTPPRKLPEVAADTFASVEVGMRQEDVVRKLGAPESKVSIPEETELIETYRYRVAPDRVGIIRFSNGVVKEISGPKS